MKPRRAFLLSITIVLALCAACGWWLHREQRQYALNRQLIDALERRDTRQALAFVNAGADPDTREDPAPAPTLNLLLAHLLNRKHLPVNNTPTALIMACGDTWYTTNGVVKIQQRLPEDLPLLQAMLAHGANVQGQTTVKWTALHSVALDGRLHTAELLLQHGADINARDERGQTPLILAVSSDTMPMVHLLLSQGANPNAQDVDGQTALHDAVLSSDGNHLLRELLAHGADPNQRAEDGQTPFQYAQKLGNPEFVRLLKQHGAK